MPSTYSPSLRLELIGAGEQAGTWGTTTNTNIGTLLEQAIAGAVNISMSDANFTLSTANGASDQARRMYINATSSVPLTNTRTITCPAVSKMYVVRNATSGGQSIIISAGGIGVTIRNGETSAVFCDGVDIRLINTDVVTPTGIQTLTNKTLTSPVITSISNGGTITIPAGTSTLVTTAGDQSITGMVSASGGFSIAGSKLSTQPTFRNRIINGDFLVWQRGTSQTLSGYGSDDRWVNANNGSSKSHTRQLFTLGQTAVPGEPIAYSRTVVTSVGGASNFVVKHQRMEGVRTLAGQTLTLSFWAKADAARPIAIDFAQNFGTGGSPSAAVTAIGAQKFNLTTSWQQFTATISVPSISGKTIGTDNNDFFELTFWFDAGSSYNARTASLGQQSGTFEIARVQVEAGSAATPFEVRPIGTELMLCQRYYQTASYFILYGSYAVGAYGQVQITFPTVMRATPAVNLTPGFSSNVNSVSVVGENSQSMALRVTSTAITVGAEASGTYRVDAEL